MAVINLDTATVEELTFLNNVGPVSARAIVDNRPITTWEQLHRCAPKLARRDVLAWHQNGVLTSRIPEFQNLIPDNSHVSATLLDPLMSNQLDALCQHVGRTKQEPRDGARQPKDHVDANDVNPLSAAGAYLPLDLDMSLLGACQAPPKPPMSMQSTYPPEHGIIGGGPGNMNPSGINHGESKPPSIDLYMNDTKPGRTSRHHRKDSTSSNSSNDSGSVQRGILAIVDGLHKLNESFCQGVREQQRTQERFLENQQRLLNNIVNDHKRHEEILLERQDSFLKQIKDVVCEMKTANSSDAATQRIEAALKELKTTPAVISPVTVTT